jgi:hypothetical protein
MMISPPQRKRKKKRIHSLKDPALRKIRYNFRSLLYLWYKEKGKEYLAEKAEIRDNKTLSYQQRKRLLRKLREADEELQYTLAAAPLGCGWCSNMMDDLVLEPKRQTYYCVACYEKVHRLYPDEYP